MRFKLPLLLALVMVAAPIWAHHGATGFDEKRPLHLIGKVTMVDWVNPHVVIHLEAPGPDGKVAIWLVNTFPPNAGKRQGYSTSTFLPGTELTVDGYQASDGSTNVNGVTLVFKDGKKIVGTDCFAPGAQCFVPVPTR